jgi:TonB family protein
MRRLAILALLLATAASAYAASYESRTPRHALAVDIVSISGDDVVFGVTVTDVPGGQVLASPRLTGKIGVPAEFEVDAGEQHVKIRVSLQGTVLSCKLSIARGDAILDSMEAVWATQTQRTSGQADGLLHVGGDVKAPVVLKRVSPMYPDIARREKVSGFVVMEVVIDRTGALKDIRVIQPLPDGLSEAAVEAVKQWTFAPGTLDGKPVDVVFNLTINFKL